MCPSHVDQSCIFDCNYCDKQLFEAKGRIVFLNYNTVYKQKCDYDGELIYDGQKHCLLAMNQHLFAYEVLQQFMFQFLLGRWRPFVMYDHEYHCNGLFNGTTIFTVLTMIHKDAGNPSFSKIVNYNHFRAAWYVFLELMSADKLLMDSFVLTVAHTLLL